MTAQDGAHERTDPLGGRLRSLRERRGWNQSELGRRAGVDRSEISRIEGGKPLNPGRDVLTKLAAALRVEVAELMGPMPVRRRRAEIQEGVGRVPLMSLRVQASGEPVWDETTEEVITAPLQLRGRPNAFAAVVSGTCMEPWVSAGDTVLIDPDRVPADGEMVVITEAGGGTLVKWFRVDELGRAFLRAADGTELRPQRATVEGVVFKIEREAPRDPETRRPSIRRVADDRINYQP